MHLGGGDATVRLSTPRQALHRRISGEVEFSMTKAFWQSISEWQQGKLQIEAAGEQDRRFRVEEVVTIFLSLPLELVNLGVILES